MFTSATGYIFSFGLSRRRHEPPFKPGGSVGALVGRPGFRAGFARIRARGRGRGSVGAACSSRKKPLDCRLAIQLSSNLLSSKAASLRGRPVFPCLLCVPTTKIAKGLREEALADFPSERSTCLSSSRCHAKGIASNNFATQTRSARTMPKTLSWLSLNLHHKRGLLRKCC